MSSTAMPRGVVFLLAIVGAAALPIERQQSTSVSFLGAWQKFEDGVASESVSVSDSNAESAGGPSSLKEYCEGGTGEPAEGSKVEANWKGFGEFYPGEVKQINDDGTVDILYDDGWVEKNLEMDEGEVKPLKTDTKSDPVNDPACKLQDDIEEVKKVISNAFGEVAKFMAGQRAGVTAEKTEKPEVVRSASPAPAPGAPMAAIPTEEPTDELRDLWAQLAELDKEIAALQKSIGEKDALIDQELLEDAGGYPATWSVADQIADITAKLKRRKRELERLKDKSERQDSKLAKLSPVSLDAIQELVRAIDMDLAEIRRKRDRLEKAGELDPELRFGVDSLLTQGTKLSDQVGGLVAAADEAAKDASAKAQQAVLDAAEQVAQAMEGVKEGAKQLDQGVHPNGEKWWRYRYERSYVEAFLMVIVSILMLLWERLYYYMRRKAYAHSDAKEHDDVTDGTMYIKWLEFFAGEIMVCLFVYLTIWAFAQVGLWDVFKHVFHGTPFHVPSSGKEYRRMMLDVCVILFFAVLFFFILALSIVHATTIKLRDWKDLEEAGEDGTVVLSRSIYRLATTPKEYHALKMYFLQNVKKDMKGIQGLDEQFPLWKYFRLSVRDSVDHMFEFGLTVWLLIVFTFIGFMCLHRYLYIGYIRIMMVLLVLMAVLLVSMVIWIRSINKEAMSAHNKAVEADAPGGRRAFKRAPSMISLDESPKVKSIHQQFATEYIVAVVVTYVLFFLCYGAARIVCQKWMWQLYFWPVLTLTLMTVLAAMVFVFVVAPIIPIFAAALSLPPYIDPANAEQIHQVIAEQQEAKIAAAAE